MRLGCFLSLLTDAVVSCRLRLTCLIYVVTHAQMLGFRFCSRSPYQVNPKRALRRAWMGILASLVWHEKDEQTSGTWCSIRFADILLFSFLSGLCASFFLFCESLFLCF